MRKARLNEMVPYFLDYRAIPFFFGGGGGGSNLTPRHIVDGMFYFEPETETTYSGKLSSDIL